jgi:hypothetical protein
MQTTEGPLIIAGTGETVTVKVEKLPIAGTV